MEGLHNTAGEGVLASSILSPTSELGKMVTRGRVFPFPCLRISLECLHLPHVLELGCWEGR